jgi:uncharacterized protein Yka (UPF0111/DUF47 family)
MNQLEAYVLNRTINAVFLAGKGKTTEAIAALVELHKEHELLLEINKVAVTKIEHQRDLYKRRTLRVLPEPVRVAA